MVKLLFDKIASRTRLGFLIAFFLLILSYFLTIISTNKVINQANRVNETNMVIHTMDKGLGYEIQAEAFYRVFLITKDEQYLNKFRMNNEKADSVWMLLKPGLAGNQDQINNLNQLFHFIREKKEWMTKFADRFRSLPVDNPELNRELKTGVALTEKISSQVGKMQLIESSIWQDRGKEVSEYTGLIKVFNTISIILAILFTLFSLFVYNKENKAKREETQKAGDFRKQLENRINELADLNKELIDLRSQEKYAVTGRIARTIAHEVRNPLTNINLSIEQLRLEVESTETTELFFKMIIRNSERINNLVSDLLNSTRVSELKFQEMNINKVLDESLDMALDRVDLKHVKVNRIYDPNIGKLQADPDKLKVAFLNIIVNAIEAMETNGVLTIKTIAENQKCYIMIADNGIGMEKEQMDKLFEPYFTTKEKGNGLGLANTQNIILSHNGNISAKSIPGKGTTFTIILNV